MAAPPKQFDWQRQRILLLDQDDQFRFWARGVFNRLGAAEVISTASGFDALHALERTDATLGMIDLEFKGMTAAEFIRDVRAKRAQRLSALPIILMAKTQDKKSIYEASLQGIEGIIVKPIAEKAMLTRVVATILKPERIVLNSAFAGPDRRELPRIQPEAPNAAPATRTRSEPRTAARPAGKERTVPTGVVLKPQGKNAPTRAAAPKGEPIETRDPVAPTEKPAPAKLSDTDIVAAKPKAEIRDFKDEVAATPKKEVRDFKDEVADTPKKEVRDFADEVVQAPPKKERPDWKAALVPKKKDKKKERDSKPSVDIVGILGAHQAWLDSNGQEGEKARFEGMDLSGADLAGANLANASMRGVNLSDSDCSGAQMMSAELRRANLSGARLAGADLSYAAMRHVDLSLADLSGAVLVGADLAGARLAKTNVKQADLTRASLLGADLDNANLEEAGGLTQSQVGKAYGTKSTKLPPGLKAGSPEEWSENL